MTIKRAITVAQAIDTAGLNDALLAAGIPTEGVGSTFNTNGQIEVRYTDVSTAQQRGADTDTVLTSFIAAQAAAATDKAARKTAHDNQHTSNKANYQGANIATLNANDVKALLLLLLADAGYLKQVGGNTVIDIPNGN